MKTSSTSSTFVDITPERIAQITQRARKERSEAMWRLLADIFRSRAADDLPEAVGTAPKPRG